MLKYYRVIRLLIRNLCGSWFCVFCVLFCFYLFVPSLCKTEIKELQGLSCNEKKELILDQLIERQEDATTVDTLYYSRLGFLPGGKDVKNPSGHLKCYKCLAQYRALSLTRKTPANIIGLSYVPQLKK